MASYIESIGDTIYGDVPPDELARFHYRVLGFGHEPEFSRLRTAGLTSDYVYRETKRTVDGLRGQKSKILTGIDVDIPIREEDMTKEQSSDPIQATRATTAEVVMQALRVGAHGIVISRKYSEMRLETLSGVSDAVRDGNSNTKG
jgi:hypothetical protein